MKSGVSRVKPKKKYSTEDLAGHAKNSSLEDLERQIRESPDPRVRKAAHVEMDRRVKKEHTQEEGSDNEKTKD